MYREVIDDYENLDKLRKQVKRDGAGGDEKEEDDYKDQAFDNDAPIANRDPRTKTTIRNLRIREDTAKYLLNLDDQSAYYDGKSRSMRENPNPHLPMDKQMFKGDNQLRFTGETMNLLEQERFVWENVDKNLNQDVLNTIALPTATEVIHKKTKENLSKELEEKKKKLFSMYGGEQHLEETEAMLLAQTDRYVEFTLDGRVKMTPADGYKAVNKSKYEEDVYVNDHTSVWGSWWSKELGWGFACCHSTKRDSRCLGDQGKKLALVREYKIVKEREDKMRKAEQMLLGVIEGPTVQRQEVPREEKTGPQPQVERQEKTEPTAKREETNPTLELKPPEPKVAETIEPSKGREAQPERKKSSSVPLKEEKVSSSSDENSSSESESDSDSD
eukprot:TRINITY_DN4434_c0_g1_i4.p1 TRINITY_DN4434_c0_g1~~TRINITY_DN4434_c0_g1_i4.p1  ORF type:complete len:387 (-),score=121.76 TRINITY_DN4434_c0_g1_i4:40-1200(-)